MFNLFKGPNASINVTLDRTTFRPGETIQAQITAQSEKDLPIQEGRAALVLRMEIQRRYEETRRDSDGHMHTGETRSWHNSESEVAKTVLLQAGTLAGGSPQTFQCSFTIPPELPVTCAGGQIMRARWWVKATLARKMAKDVEGKADITVYNPPPPSSGPGQFGASNEPGEAGMTLALPRREFAVGETIEGQLLVRPQKAFGVSEVRVELVGIERVPSGLGMSIGPVPPVIATGLQILASSNRKVLVNEAQHVQKVKVAAGVKFQPGQEVAYPFRLTVPTPGPVTCQVFDSAVGWMLRGVLARSLRADTRVEEEIIVCALRS